MAGLLVALRPRQWTKNLLLFAGVLFSQHLGDLPLLLRACAGFAAFSLLASAGYLVNDLRDAAADREHPEKRHRPIPSGALPVGVARAAVVPLVAAAVPLAWWLGPGFTGVAGAYLALNLAYSAFFKSVVLLDVLTISTGFVLRAIAGVALLQPVAPETQLSPWLLVCTFFGATFLALGKRRRELGNAGDQAVRQRTVLTHYTTAYLDGLLAVSASASLIAYALYTIWPGTVAKFGTEALLYTIPFVAYGLFRYLLLVQTTEKGEDPAAVLWADGPLAACVVMYLATVILILYRT